MTRLILPLTLALLVASCESGPTPEEFCAETPNGGLACDDGAGVCQEEKCVTCPAQVAIKGAAQCFEPTCCTVPEDVLTKACSQFFPDKPRAVVCGSDKAGDLKCASLDFKPTCAWGEGGTFTALCCE